MGTLKKVSELPELASLQGVGPQILKHFKALGITTSQELLLYFPKKYDDFSHIVLTREASPGALSVKGHIHITKSRYSKRGLHITEGYIEDDSGRLMITWFNQPYRAKSLKIGEEYFVSGTYDMHGMQLCFVNPVIESAYTLDETSRIIGHYKDMSGLSSRQIRTIVRRLIDCLPKLPDRLPEWIIHEEKILSLDETIRQLHFPTNKASLDQAKHRLSFEELFHLQLASAMTRNALKQEKAPVIPFHETVAKDFVRALKFSLTEDQRRVCWQIYKDMTMGQPMNRLVEGDVGSGKTVVAAMASIMAVEAGYQVLYMAPTELLARQHANTYAELLAHTRWANSIHLLIGSMTKKQKDAVYESVQSGNCKIVIGTHALIQDRLKTDRVGLVIIDEQHRFGVEQRQKLRQAGGYFPHVLSMTATPIPRTLALTLYGELDISMIHAKPSGRKSVITEVIQHEARASVYEQVDALIKKGRQAFIVTPLIADSPMLQTKAAESLYKELQTGLLRRRRLGLLHGGLKANDKELVMQQFINGSIDALIATTVVEVGVNVPNATIMIIEGAERFGLAQLHQLRGRVGRAAEQGYCYLIPSQDVGISKRMRAIATTNDGFKLAELDLELRGPGAIYGVRQSGALDLSFATLSDRRLVASAKQTAQRFIEKGEKLIHYPYISERVKHFQSISHLN